MAQSGALISLIVECFLDTHHLTLARFADSLACRRVELLIADSGEVNIATSFVQPYQTSVYLSVCCVVASG